MLFPVLSVAGEKKTIVHSVSKNDMLLLREVDRRYQKDHGIHMKLKKTITLGMLGSTKKSEGEVWLDKGQMRLEIHKPEVSKIVAGKKYQGVLPQPQFVQQLQDFPGAAVDILDHVAVGAGA